MNRVRVETRPIVTEADEFKPILAWATLGGVLVALFAYLLTMWFVSGDATPTPAGDVPLYTTIAARTWEVLQLVFVPVFIWHMVIRPYRQTGSLTTDGVMILAFLTLWWQDTVCNSLAPFTHNSAAFLNLGSWDAHIPFWVAPNGSRTVEPPLGSSGIMYLWAPWAAAWVGCWVIRKAKERWPSIGRMRQLAISVVVVGVATGLAEIPALRLGLWAYQGAHESVTLFSGHFYQYPLYEGLFFGLVGTAWAAIRMFKGQTFAERGLERLNYRPRRRELVRVLAMGGLLNVTFLMWQVPMAIISLHQEAWPEDIVKRTYLTNAVCGPGTDYACPGAEIPINRTNSVHLDPDGRLVVPEGVRLPEGGTTWTSGPGFGR
jgi:hypothetical protein